MLPAHRRAAGEHVEPSLYPIRGGDTVGLMAKAHDSVISWSGHGWCGTPFVPHIQKAGRRQAVQPVKHATHLRREPKSVPTRCGDAASGEVGGDGIRCCYAARLYLRNNRSKRSSPCICARCTCHTGSLAGLRRCHIITPASLNVRHDSGSAVRFKDVRR
jgi:hypothetical protein